MAHISFAQSLRISQVAAVIPMLSATVEGEDGHITPILLSEPGVGKTSVLKLLEQQLGDEYDYIYVDCPCKDLMDIAATIPNHADKSLEQYVGALFKMDSPRKKVILFDVRARHRRPPVAVGLDCVRHVEQCGRRRWRFHAGTYRQPRVSSTGGEV